ncbi:hypothetical protein HK405_001004, partial [Cladochytrium tenue]
DHVDYKRQSEAERERLAAAAREQAGRLAAARESLGRSESLNAKLVGELDRLRARFGRLRDAIGGGDSDGGGGGV